MTTKQSKGVTFVTGWDADKITCALRAAHHDDLFVAECKNGPTFNTPHLYRLDAWVLRRTYSPPMTIGYEIKVSRQDFEQDQKWTAYLDVCDLFYFVCPAGLIRAAELPKGIGLKWVSASGKVHTKLIAERHPVDLEKQNRLLTYVLMSRARVVANMGEANSAVDDADPLARRRRWIEEAEKKQDLAYFVRGHIQRAAQHLRERELTLQQREQRVEQFEEHLRRLGITWDSTKSDWTESNRVDQEIAKLRQVFDPYTLSSIADTGQRMINLAVELKKLHEVQKEEVKP